jgi:WD40 repeat protein
MRKFYWEPLIYLNRAATFSKQCLIDITVTRQSMNQVQLLHSFQLGNRSTSRDILGLECWPKRLCLTHKLEKHRRCVNTVQWNHDGSLLISGSDDRHLGIWCGNTFRLLSYLPTNHTNNIFCAKFIPDSGDSKIISCAADGEVHFMDIGQSPLTNPSPSIIRRERISERENNIAMKFEFLPGCPNAFLTTHQNGEVGLIDIRSIQRNSAVEEILVRLHRMACFSLCFDPTQPNTFALSSSDHLIRLYDIRVPSRPYMQSYDSGCIQKFCHPSKYTLHTCVSLWTNQEKETNSREKNYLKSIGIDCITSGECPIMPQMFNLVRKGNYL